MLLNAFHLPARHVPRQIEIENHERRRNQETGAPEELAEDGTTNRHRIED
jgi:hypothetical protein